MRKLTREEEEAVRKIGNKAFDLLSDTGMSEERAEEIAAEAESAVRTALEQGK